MPCRLNRRRLWTHRLLLEQRCHEFSCFATLTYSDDNLPEGGSLRPKDMQLWLKRLRSLLGAARPIRFYAVGEYGENTWRPHYHAALFGLSDLEGPLLDRSWQLGSVHVGQLTRESAQYIAGYVTKKMVDPEDPRLGGRHPEFARMSRRPGIGAGAVPVVAEALNDTHGARSIAVVGDVPQALNHGRVSLPLGRYLRRKLREEMGFAEIGGQEVTKVRQAAELRALCEVEGGVSAHLAKRAAKEDQLIRQIEGKAKIYSKKGSI